jgi:uncharacterized protein with gpF-like domain
MSIFNLFKKRGKTTSVDQERPDRIPTVQFDQTRVNKIVEHDIKQNIRAFIDINDKYFDLVFKAALQSISSGRDLNVLYQALITVDGMAKSRASAIALELNNKTTALMEDERRVALGITHAVWLYSGAPCGNHDAEHKAANGAFYRIGEGLFIGGAWTSPGREAGCRCVSKSAIKGFT